MDHTYTDEMYKEDVSLSKGFLRRCYARLANSEDAIQECVIWLWQSRKQFEGKSEYSTYANKCLENFMIEKFNKKGNRQKRNNHIKIDYDNDGGKLPQKKVVKIADVSLDDIVLATNDDSSDMHEIIRAQHDYIEDAINNKLAQHIIKTMNNKHIGKIVYYISQGFKQTEISKITGLNKDTINKYFSEFKKRFKAEYKG